MYGALAYGSAPHGSVGDSVAGDPVFIIVEPVFAASAIHGIGVIASIVAPIEVSIGADPTPMTVMAVIESGLSVSIESEIPTYAVGLIALKVSVSAIGNTSVIGVGDIRVSLGVVSYASHPLPFSAGIIAPIMVSIAARAEPDGFVAIYPPVTTHIDGLVVTHGRGAIKVPAYVSASLVTGFVGSVSATIKSVFSATAAHSKTATLAIAPVVYISGIANHGCAISGAIDLQLSVSALAGAYSDIQASAAIKVPFSTYIRGISGDDFSNANRVYILTKQNSVSVLK